jgi:integrase
VLRLPDLDGRILTIERSLSAGVLGPTKSGRTRRLTLATGTVEVIQRHVRAWEARVQPEQHWLFSPSPRRSAHLTADALSHRLARLAPASGVEHPALHRLRHGVATYLVDQGRLLKAQGRLGHRDPATTLRHYSHAIPLDDIDVADDLDRVLNGLDPRCRT